MTMTPSTGHWLRRYSTVACIYAWNSVSMSSEKAGFLAAKSNECCVPDSEGDQWTVVCCWLVSPWQRRFSRFASNGHHYSVNQGADRDDLNRTSRFCTSWRSWDGVLLVFWHCSACPEGIHLPELNFQWLTSTNTISTYILYVASGFKPKTLNSSVGNIRRPADRKDLKKQCTVEESLPYSYSWW